MTAEPANRDSSRELDRVDRQLLSLLQADGRLTVAELARTVNLTLTPCIERVRRLEREGFIEGYFARLSPRRLGQQLMAFTEVTLDHANPDVFQRFKDTVQLVDEIVECHMVAGGFDYLLKTRVQDMDEYRRVLGDKIASLRGVRHTQTYFVLEEVKSTHALRDPRRRHDARSGEAPTEVRVDTIRAPCPALASCSSPRSPCWRSPATHSCAASLSRHTIDAGTFTTVRIVSGALTLWIIVQVRSGAGGLAGNWPSAAALFAYAAGFSLAYINLSAATGALLLFGAVQATMIGYGFWNGDRLRGWQLVGFVCAVLGLVALLLPGLRQRRRCTAPR